ncbi:MAG: ATP-binding cassette domain-containing protein, partial [Synergistaceae bacterium]|nr:ATP-binding cassette domain-containing protein [Synergistaceae bacterium]
MIDIRNLTLSSGEHKIFSGLNLQIPNTARLGIVGANGAGKTTLLRVLMGEVEPDSGSVERSRELTVGCL